MILKLILIAALLITSKAKAAEMPLSIDELPTSIVAPFIEANGTQVDEHSKDSKVKKLYLDIKNFISGCDILKQRLFDKEKFDRCYSKNAQVQKLDFKEKKLNSSDFNGISKFSEFLTSKYNFAESFYNERNVWVFQIKQNSDWFILIFNSYQTFNEGLYEAENVALVKRKKEKFSIVREKTFSLTYDLQRSPVRGFLEYVAKIHGGQTTSTVLSLSLKPIKIGFEYKISFYAGDGALDKNGKIDKDGRLIEREVDYKYCTHSMGPEDLCYDFYLQQKFNSSPARLSLSSGHYKERKRASGKETVNIQIKDKTTLDKAREAFEDKDIWRIYFNKPIPKKFLIPLEYNSN